MLFNSYAFLLFFPIVCLIYWGIKGKHALTLRNNFLLIASYYFYMNWQPEYALLLLTSTTITYLAAIGIDSFPNQKHKKLCLVGSIVSNISILFFYKYYGFAAENITNLFDYLGIAVKIPEFNYLLPVGISFYIFQAVGYSIDVYRGTTKVERNFLTYALFVSFFPQLVAGPIERSTNLLQQFKSTHKFDEDQAIAGLKLMIWGYFMKLVLADRCAMYVDQVFNNLDAHAGYSTAIASVLFSFQIYGDFAGYTFIAIGAAKILGFNLMDNFRRPYFATSITDFWRRWHISLSTWFRDYIYFPLGGNRCSKARCYFNLMVTFFISGIWHGANWTFILWGTMHGVIQCIERSLGYNKKVWAGLAKYMHMFTTFIIATLAWVLFRANNISDGAKAIYQIFTTNPLETFNDRVTIYYCILAISILMVKEFFEEYQKSFKIFSNNPTIIGNAWMIFLLISISFMGVFDGGRFIYFQF